MVSLAEGKETIFADFRFDAPQLRNIIDNCRFLNSRTITKSMLTWWAFRDSNQQLLRLETPMETEHIYARNRCRHEQSLSDRNLVESLGNKAVLEKRINIRASDCRFADKVRYYRGYRTPKGVETEGTQVAELRTMADTRQDFGEEDIKARYTAIVDAFLACLDSQNLLA